MLDSISQALVSPNKAESKTRPTGGNAESSEAFLVARDSFSTSEDASHGDALRQQATRLLSSAPAERAAVTPDQEIQNIQRSARMLLDRNGLDADIFGNKANTKSAFETQSQKLLANFQRVTDAATLSEIKHYKQTVEEGIKSGLLSRDEVTATYQQINKLLKTSSPFLNDAQRADVAGGILFHTAQGRIDQGFHRTGHVSALQNIAFSERPSLAAEMITTAALTGEWRARDGKVIKMPKDSMTPGWEELFFPPVDGWRTHASQIFQVVALNDIGMRENDPKHFVHKPTPEGGYRHMLTMKHLPWSEYWMPNGAEVWRDTRGREMPFNGVSGRQIQEASKRLFGDKYETIAYRSPYEAVSHPWTSDKNDYKSTSLVETESGLRQKLIHLKDSGRLPAIVAVNSDALPSEGPKAFEQKLLNASRLVTRPFKSAHEAIDAKLGIANHAVTVVNYDPKTDRVFFKDSRGKERADWIAVRDLWKAL